MPWLDHVELFESIISKASARAFTWITGLYFLSWLQTMQIDSVENSHVLTRRLFYSMCEMCASEMKLKGYIVLGVRKRSICAKEQSHLEDTEAKTKGNKEISK